MSKSIPLSPKHGVNPTIPVCAWCGEHKNEIAFMGRIKTDIRGEDPKAPMYTVLDYEPCDKCKEQWSKGVTVISVTTQRPTPYRPPIQVQKDGTELYPTMRMVVVRPESINRILDNGNFEAGQRVFFEDTAFEQIFGDAINSMHKGE